MPAYRKTTVYLKPKSRQLGGVVKRTIGSSGVSRGTPMQLVTGGLAPLRTGGYFGTRRSMQEKKTVDVNVTTTNVFSTASLTLLNGIATGTDFTDRIGRKVILKSLFIRYTITPEDNTTSNNPVRITIVYDNQTNGTAPAQADIFKENSPYSQLNLNNRDRFQVLYDKFQVLGGVDTTATSAFSNGHNCFAYKKYKRLNHEMIFGGTAATVASIQTGSIYLYMQAVAGAGGSCNVNWTSRIRFVDA